jgi:hypothetical protein
VRVAATGRAAIASKGGRDRKDPDMRTRLLPLLALAGIAAAPLHARAVDVGEGRLSINGYGGWAYGLTSRDNYLIGSNEGRYDNATLALAVQATAHDDVVAAGQLSIDGEGVALEWAFGEWRIADEFRLRFGKVKQPFGFFMEVADVGTLRPFYSLPITIYGPSGLGTKAYLGAGITGGVALGAGWRLEYDLYGGAIEMEVLDTTDAFRPSWTEPRPIEPELDILRNMAGARAMVVTPWGVRLALSGHGGGQENAGDPIQYAVYGASLDYAAGPFAARAEGFIQWEEDGDGATGSYVEADYRFLGKWQVAGRLEYGTTKVEEFSGDSPLLKHREAALGLNYWIEPEMVIKASYHLFDGHRFALPEVFDRTLEDRSNYMVVLGAQFSF